MEDEVEGQTPAEGSEESEVVEVEGQEPQTPAEEPDTHDEVTVSIGDETPPEDDERRAPAWVTELRKSNREKDRELRELREKVNAQQAPPQAVLGPKPKLEDCDYDTARFETLLEAWHDRKRAVDEEQGKKRKAEEDAKAAWDARLAHHSKLKGELKVKDFDDAEAAVESSLNVTQRGLIVHGADNSALLFYALGKNPKKLQELASEKDPVKFAFAVARLETKLKVTPRKAAPLPERQVRGSAPVTGVVDSHLARLEAEADRTGDRSKVAAYRTELRNKSRK